MESLASDYMHGSIFMFLKRFVENEYDYSACIRIVDELGLRRVQIRVEFA